MFDIWVWINTYENTIFRWLFTSIYQINPSYFGVQRMKRICHWIFTQLHPVAKWDIKTVCWGPACVSKVDHDML